MKKNHGKKWNKENFLVNGVRDQSQWAKNKLNTTVQEPGINESGIEAKKKGY